MSVPQLASGARGKILINGKAKAFITNVSVNRIHSVAAPHTFGAYHARSTEPLSTSVSVSIGTVIPVNDADGNPVDMSAIASGVVPLLNQMATAEDVTIEYQDTPSSTTVSCLRNCRPTSDTLNLSAQQLAAGGWSLIAIYDSANGNVAQQLGY